jgi:hypothetical protein
MNDDIVHDLRPLKAKLRASKYETEPIDALVRTLADRLNDNGYAIGVKLVVELLFADLARGKCGFGSELPGCLVGLPVIALAALRTVVAGLLQDAGADEDVVNAVARLDHESRHDQSCDPWTPKARVLPRGLGGGCGVHSVGILGRRERRRRAKLRRRARDREVAVTGFGCTRIAARDAGYRSRLVKDYARLWIPMPWWATHDGRRSWLADDAARKRKERDGRT